MQPIAQSLFGHLPTELVVLILTFSARPHFRRISDVTGRTRGSDVYSSALALCLVSRHIRRLVLPLILETLFLWEDHNVIAFLRALRMQNNYHLQGNHLHFEYAAHICRVCVGRLCEPLEVSTESVIGLGVKVRSPPATLSATDFSILAPVILAASSLAIDFESLHLLCGCLQHAWRRPVNTDMHNPSQPPWSTKTLTLSGTFNPAHLLATTAQGSAFLASISHLIFLPPTITESEMRIRQLQEEEDVKLPPWMMRISWASFKSLRSVLLPLPYAKLPVVEGQYTSGRRVDLLTLFVPSDASVHTSARHLSCRLRRVFLSRGVYKKINTHGCPVTGGGRILGVKDDIVQGYTLLIDWDETWACGIEDGL
ncbi:hypothetical protein K503DRAFT_775177 [Rhizopogon vinicolor AM-OR11-026]|uniref:F-box domain-containing protein n=1 Tax=Rhizopogon vinicolor AM-OR11-026 TaxID=1314800 RepID=A0A1B7MMK5_9AGAM|nr:hypothetical protein K503DRAFT_775177 [Rhizopogon vinicolor AM-OR11-026]